MNSKNIISNYFETKNQGKTADDSFDLDVKCVQKEYVKIVKFFNETYVKNSSNNLYRLYIFNDIYIHELEEGKFLGYLYNVYFQLCEDKKGFISFFICSIYNSIESNKLDKNNCFYNVVEKKFFHSKIKNQASKFVLCYLDYVNENDFSDDHFGYDTCYEMLFLAKKLFKLNQNKINTYLKVAYNHVHPDYDKLVIIDNDVENNRGYYINGIQSNNFILFFDRAYIKVLLKKGCFDDKFYYWLLQEFENVEISEQNSEHLQKCFVYEKLIENINRIINLDKSLSEEIRKELKKN